MSSTGHARPGRLWIWMASLPISDLALNTEAQHHQVVEGSWSGNQALRQVARTLDHCRCWMCERGPRGGDDCPAHLVRPGA
jgi:hypothetical protein